MVSHGAMSRLFYLFAASTLSAEILPTQSLSVSPRNKCLIKICHNKDCTKKGGGDPLVQTFRDLIPASSGSASTAQSNDLVISVEKSGCLSQCGRGPNVSVVNDKNEEKMYFGVADAMTASAVLEVAADEEYPIALLVAATVISEAEQATSPSKKETLLTSAVDALTKDQDPSLLNSYAHAHTLFLRADARLEMKPPNVDGAINDARMSVKINPTCRKAWRVLASAEEAGGDLKSAMEAVSEWAKVDPAFASKAKKEIQRLSSML